MNINIKSLLENYNFNVSALIPSGKFEAFIHKCGLAPRFNKKLLERLEKQKLFFPMVRVLNKPIKYNVKKVDQLRGLGWKDGRGTNWQCISRNKENPEWKGVVKSARSQFSWSKYDVATYLDEGLTIDPTSARFKPWDQYKEDGFNKRGECYYSYFQLFHIKKVIDSIIVEISDATLLGDLYEQNMKHFKQSVKNSVEHLRNKAVEYHKQALLLQLLSDRYLPYAQSNQRTLSFSCPHGFELSRVRELWDSKTIAMQYEITVEESKEIHRLLKLYADTCDPVGGWHQLTVFMPWNEKKRAKGDALAAQYLYNHEHMMRMFHKDAFDEQLTAPHYENLTDVKYNHGVTDEKSALPYLEYVVNRYTLNPQPRLIFVVEGATEECFFKQVIERLWGRDIEQTGIKIWSIKGVDKFAGKQNLHLYGALERFIDYNHFVNGCIVFCLFDNEGGVPRVVKELMAKQSELQLTRGAQDKVTYSEYIYIWENDFESDNFTYNEIANAMSQQANEKGYPTLFNSTDVETAQRNLSGSYLSKLFKEKTKKKLFKPALSLTLLDNYIKDVLPTYNEEKDHRPFIEVASRILNMARWNFEPTCEESKINSIKYFFSDIEEMKQKRRKRFGIEE